MAIEADHLKHLSPIQALILLLLDSENAQPVKGRTWLQKEMFLILSNAGKEIEEEAQFEPHHFGPYSEVVESELANLKLLGLVDENKEIRITKAGKKIAAELRKYVSPKFLEFISQVKRELNDLTEDELLAYIYFTFPEMTSESKALERILKKRKWLALSLYRKGKVSLSKASQIAGVSVSEFSKFLRSKNIGVSLGW
ncbi:protein of unknown function UPF0175 [Ferroglobus placidus DSM 10642]|uniref:Antitoxin SocA-like Panacea domain-containing protein n=1 Tax=Ferroglobus placidus (strain DSM 10642 / AEDII12DO) TaxID=589924 RepID=D3RZ87_FERPA|nr:UPF0175 family protein [Ferroglobus placidus]ADC65800.1 protein of unknown function UPF0175 [Ferroglobus placidus DSM 10642]